MDIEKRLKWLNANAIYGLNPRRRRTMGNMAEIELVIKIPEVAYKYYKDRIPIIGDARMDVIPRSIALGTPLPKGHGKLIDEKEISLSGIHFATELDHATMIGRLNAAPAIVEADKEGVG